MFATIAMLIEPPVMPAAIAVLSITLHLATPAAIAVMIEPPVMLAATAMLIISVHLAVPGGYVNVYDNRYVEGASGDDGGHGTANYHGAFGSARSNCCDD